MSVLKWRKGLLLYPKYLWRHPTRRRIPKLLIEQRSSEVGVKVFLQDSYFAFQETNARSKDLFGKQSKIPLLPYKNSYLLPESVGGEKLFDYLERKGNYSLIFSHEGRSYYLTRKPRGADYDTAQ